MLIKGNRVELNHLDVCQALVDYVQEKYPYAKIVPRFRNAMDINNYVKISDEKCEQPWIVAEIIIEEAK